MKEEVTCFAEQFRLIRFFSLFKAKTGYGRLDSAKVYSIHFAV